MVTPLVSAAYCRLVFLCFVGVYFSASVILQGEITLRNANRPTANAAGYEILSYVVLYSARSWYISQEKQVVCELI